jgi:hypothetical protein
VRGDRTVPGICEWPGPQLLLDDDMRKLTGPKPTYRSNLVGSFPNAVRVNVPLVDYTLIWIASGWPTGNTCSSPSHRKEGWSAIAGVVLGFLGEILDAGARESVHKDLAVQRGRNEW